MISSSAAFDAAIRKDSRTFAAKILSEGSEINCEIISIQTVEGACDGQSLSIGSVFSSSASITVAGLTDILENADITLRIGVKLDDETFEYIDYADFTVIGVHKTAFQAVLTCAGVISAKLNAPLAITGQPTIRSLLDQIQAASGVTIAVDPTLGGLNERITASLSGLTLRGALAVAASLLGGYATEDHTGGVAIKKYTTNVDKIAVTPDRSIAAPVTADDTFTLTGVKVIVDENAYLRTADMTVTAGKNYYYWNATLGTYDLVDEPSGNPAAQGWFEIGELSFSAGDPIRQTYINKYMTGDIFSYFADNVLGYTFMPAEIDLTLGDPRLEPWDCLAASEIGSDTVYTVPCHQLHNTFDGGFSTRIFAVGESLSSGDVEGPVARKINDLTEDLAVAQNAATQARNAAKAANGLLDQMEQYAIEAGTTLTGVYQLAADAESAADQAITAAGEAQTAASTASTAASNAIMQLGLVEDVVGTLQWIEANGTYVLTQDTTVRPGKAYYTLTGGVYTLVLNPVDEDLPSYYELQLSDTVQNFITSHLSLSNAGMYLQTDGVNAKLLLSNGVYQLTSDTVVDLNKTYYTRSGPEGSYIYTKVASPVVADLGSYYEVVIPPGVSLFGPSGLIGQYGEDAQIGSSEGYNIKIKSGVDEARLSFCYAEMEIAYISGDMLYIPKAVVVDAMQVGDAAVTGAGWQWVIKDQRSELAGNLTLTWIGD